jgi:hypothetical protein
MVEGEPGDDADQRAFNHVGGIEPPTETDLEQGDIGWMAREQEERRGGLHFEHGDRRAAIFCLAFGQRVAELRVVDEPPTAHSSEAKALVKTNQIRRSIDVNFSACCFERGPHEGDAGAFAVGSRYMNDGRLPPLRITKRGKEPLNSIERKIDPFRMQRQKPRQHGIHGRCIGLPGAHAVAGAIAADGTGSIDCGALLAALRNSRHSFAIVARSSWRCTTMSTMP